MRKYICQDVLCCLLFIGLVTGCSGRRVNGETPPQLDEKDQKMENLVSALSRAQSRIEELDAKVSTLTDKLESTRVTVDNISGIKPVKTEAVGTAAYESSTNSDHLAIPAHAVSKSLTGNEARALLHMDSAINEFNKSMKLFKNGKYADAELSFNHFTETYPEHILAGSAQFYAGESYFQMGEYKLALNEYGKVISSFGSSPRVPSAMVRMAHCYSATGASAEAARTMSLARDMYIGNPSLEWDAPTPDAKEGAKVNKLKSELNASPIEPAHED